MSSLSAVYLHYSRLTLSELFTTQSTFQTSSKRLALYSHYLDDRRFTSSWNGHPIKTLFQEMLCVLPELKRA